MSSRRTVLSSLAAGAVALASSRLGAGVQQHRDGDACDCLPLGAGPNAGWLPNVEVITHRGERALFYNDLLLDRRVLVHFMSVRNERRYPTTGNLAEVAFLLGERLGQDVFIYSLSLEPELDTPSVLAEFARTFNPPEGWLFLSGAPQHIASIQSHFFADGAILGGPGADHTHHHAADHQGCTFGVLRYGNERIGIWGSVPARARPETIVARLDWIEPKPVPKGRRRGGPDPGGYTRSRHFSDAPGPAREVTP